MMLGRVGPERVPQLRVKNGLFVLTLARVRSNPFERHLKAVAPAFEDLHRSNISLQACLVQMYTGAASTKTHDLLTDMLFAQSDDIRSTLWLEIG